jgi:hypothetical protein
MPTYWRQRDDVVRAAGLYIQRMQKALTQMNIQLANVLSDGMRDDGAGDRESHPGGRTRFLSMGCASELAGEGMRGRNRAQSGRQLARRCAVCAVLSGVDVRTERTLPEGLVHHVDNSFGDIGHIGEAVAIHGFGSYRREDGDGICLSG